MRSIAAIARPSIDSRISARIRMRGVRAPHFIQRRRAEGIGKTAILPVRPAARSPWALVVVRLHWRRGQWRDLLRLRWGRGRRPFRIQPRVERGQAGLFRIVDTPLVASRTDKSFRVRYCHRSGGPEGASSSGAIDVPQRRRRARGSATLTLTPLSVDRRGPCVLVSTIATDNWCQAAYGSASHTGR